MHPYRLACLLLLLLPVALPGTAAPPPLTFAERVQAQEAITWLRHQHQLGARRPFEEVVPRERLEEQVLRYLRMSAALERFWSRPVTAEMLDRELRRMLEGSRLPGRLRDLFRALDDDPVLIRECLARPALVERLARDLYAFDPRVHRGARAEAERLHALLAAGEPVEVAPDRGGQVERLRSGPAGAGLQPGPQADDAELATLVESLRTGGDVGRVREEREAFVIDVLQEADGGDVAIARYRVVKEPWDDWWRRVEEDLDPFSVTSVASGAPLPGPRLESAETVGVGCFPDDTWLPVTAGYLPVGRGRGGLVAVWTGYEMIVFGGANAPGERYDPVTDIWLPTSSDPPPGSCGSITAVWTGSEMIVWGGRFSGCVGGRYDPATDTWSSISLVGAPTARDQHGAVWTGDRMLVWGGNGGGGSVPADGGIYDPATDTWEPMPLEGAPVPTRELTAVWTGGEMIVWGGHDGTPGGWRGDGGRFDPVTGTWAPVSTSGAPSPRMDHRAVWTGTEMIVWGGRDINNYFSTGGRYDPATDAWQSVSHGGSPTARINPATTWTGDEMVVWGGTNARGDPLGTGARYDPAADSWTGMTLVGAPAPPRDTTAVWTGTEALIWAFPSTGRYDPLTDTWTPTPLHSAPPSGSGRSAVWTGNEMIVWGAAFRSIGGRYDPALDTWNATALLGAPEGRSYHTAIWTGDEMVVWGGVRGLGPDAKYLDTGGRYDPLLDTWEATATGGFAPAGRSDHTAVWTGDEMIVWGGADRSEFGDGGRYDPVDDRWRRMREGPVPRRFHTAVWTGSEMVIWGGYSSEVGWFGSGDRYLPDRNTWTPLPAAGAPSPRYVHVAVWTGSEMIVWGGDIGGPVFSAEGARWDPLADAWQPTSLVGAPEARRYHSAVWTGERMIVWGGQARGAPGPTEVAQTGGRFDPLTDSWEPTSLQDAPPGMYAHSAVWTGDLMIVWGNREGGSYVGSGPADGDTFTCD